VTLLILTIWVSCFGALYSDNTDVTRADGYGYGNNAGFTPTLTAEDYVTYLQKMAAVASNLGMSIGLKNAESLLAMDNVMNIIQFAVNEECVVQSPSDCNLYDPLIAAGKPVFHIEYVKYSMKDNTPVLKSIEDGFTNLSSDALKPLICLHGQVEGKTFSTIIKTLDLGGWVEYCDGTWAKTAAIAGSDG
jgi:endo-alpha-1,4-polygalactosaminidase (GH114 family)